MSTPEYLILEYQTCQQKISSAVDQLNRIEVYVFLGISAIYAWFYTTIGSDVPASENIKIALYLPTLLAFLAWYRSSMQLKYIAATARYFKLIENQLSMKDADNRCWEPIGWETWHEDNGPKTWNAVYRFTLWPGLIVGTLTAAVLEFGVQ